MSAGVDTVSIAFRPRPEWFDHAMEQPHQPSGRGIVFDQRGPGESRLGLHFTGACWAEGRLGAMLDNDHRSWNLRPASDVALAERVAREALSDLADDWLDCSGEVRRYDLAHEFEFSEPSDGFAFLRTLAGMCPPRRVLDTYTGSDGQPQTVYVRQARSGIVTERCYDKGRESSSHAPGLRIRYEAQRRPKKTERMTPLAFSRVDLSPDFGRSIRPYMEGGETVIAAGTEATIEHLVGAAARGEISMAKCERMIGTVAILKRYGRAVYPDPQQQQRRLRGLRDAGVSLDRELPPDRVVPVGELLRQSMEAFSA